MSGSESALSGHDGDGSDKEKLMVALRIRPLTSEEKSRGSKVVVSKVDDKMVVLMDANKLHQDPLRRKRSSERKYAFDLTFGADSTQEEIYEKTTKPLVESVMQGFNATVFAYGATGSGKTYTMVGQPDNPGCMARALNDLFSAVDDANGEAGVSFRVTMSYLEIYNENIRDLLDPSSGHLELREDSKGRNIKVAGLTETATKNTGQIMKLLQKGNRERTQEPTGANKTSSRSHALLMVNVTQTNKTTTTGKAAIKKGRLYMIDLAGSERASQTNNSGKRLKEGAHINRSLLALGNVINALAEHKTRHVTFRDSKLTRLLKDALSGNCHTVMIAHVSSADRQRDETRNTLVYADRAKNISNKVRSNILDVSFHVSQYQTIISELRSEIGRLKEKMVFDKGNANKGSGDKRQMEELKGLRDDMVENFNEQMKLRHRLMEIDTHILTLTMEFERFNIIVSEWETEKAMNARRRRNKRLARSVSESTLDSANLPSISVRPPRGDGRRKQSLSLGRSSVPPGRRPGEERDNEEESGFEDDDEASELDFEEPEEVHRAWEELLMNQREQQRYSDIKHDLEHDLDQLRERQKHVEDELPQQISTEEEAEILTLMCKVHELEIGKAEMQSEALLKEYEVRRRDLLILKYNRQRSICDEIIQRQKTLIEALENYRQNGGGQRGAGLPMSPELMELYGLYQQELSKPENEKEVKYLSGLNAMFRSPSMSSLRGSDYDDKHSSYENRLPPISQECDSSLEKMFHFVGNGEGPSRPGSRMSLKSYPGGAPAAAQLPPKAATEKKKTSVPQQAGHRKAAAKSKGSPAKPNDAPRKTGTSTKANSGPAKPKNVSKVAKPTTKSKIPSKPTQQRTHPPPQTKTAKKASKLPTL